MKRTLIRAALAAGLALSGTAGAEVVAADDDGFDLKLSVQAPLSPAQAFDAFTDEIGQWWNGAHSYSLEPANLTLDRDCFCERWGENQVVHLQVAQFMPPWHLRLLGGLGPLQGLPMQGVMEVGFKPVEENEGATLVTLSYTVRGSGLDGWAAPVHGVLEEQLGRFAVHAGAPEPTTDPADK